VTRVITKFEWTLACRVGAVADRRGCRVRHYRTAGARNLRDQSGPWPQYPQQGVKLCSQIANAASVQMVVNSFDGDGYYVHALSGKHNKTQRDPQL
jgi:hypothetical protein